MTSHAYTTEEKRLTIAALMVVFLLSALDQTIVATAMPRIIEQLRGLELYAWVTTSYMLSSTVMVPIYGKLGDLYGRRIILLAGVVIFLTGSVLCGLSGEFGDLPILGSGMMQLIIFRSLQGLGAAALFTSAFTIIADLYPPRERAKFAGLFGSMFALASAIGPLVGGFFTDHGAVNLFGREIAGWRWVFYVNLPLGLISFFLIAFKMPDLPAKSTGRVDYLGAIFFISAIVPFLLALTWAGNRYPWVSSQIISLLIGAALALAIFVAIQKRVRDPIMPLSLFRNRVFATCNLAGFLTGMAFLGVVMFLPLFMQLVLGVNATQSGLALMPLMFGMIFSSSACGILVTRTGRYKSYVIGGMALLVLSMIFLLDIGPESTTFDLSWRMFLMGFALGPSQSIFNIAIQNAVSVTVLGVATSSSQFFRQIGSVVGIAIFGTMLTHNLMRELPRHAPEIPGMQVERVDLSEAQAQAMNPGRLRAQISEAFTKRYRLVERAYNGDEIAISTIKEDPSFSDDIKEALIEGAMPPAASMDMLPGIKQSMLSRAEVLIEMTESGIKEAFSLAITGLFGAGLWIILAAFVVTLFIPALPFRDVQLDEDDFEAT
jgi:EmrB/QacA subfamily drug resistance transporter